MFHVMLSFPYKVNCVSRKKSIPVFLGDVKHTVSTPIVIDKLVNRVNAHTPI
jgi:hypothetical protein